MRASAPRPLLIVKAGDTHPAIAHAQGDFEHWIARGLGLDGAAPVSQVHDPRHDGALPPPETQAAIVVSGSHAMVSHRAAWSEALAGWLAEAVRAGTPVLGICFGHQLLAQALGGQADDHPRGLEIGTVAIQCLPAARDDPLFGAQPARFDAQVAHRQSALRLPPGAQVLAANDWDPHQAVRFGPTAWGVQFHPEFDEAAMRGYLQQAALDPHTAPAATQARVRPTPQAAQLLRRFGHWVAAREASHTAAA